MPVDTLTEFGSAESVASEPAEKREPEARAAGGASLCPVCGQRLTVPARFCPFDGEPLVPAPARDASQDPLLGSTVDGRYEVQSVIGEGGMGTVYAARHSALGRRFAIKVLRSDLASDPEIAARFTREARTAAAVSHPGLVEITDFGTLSSGQPYFVMEYVEGQSLAALIRELGALPQDRVIEIVKQLAEALLAAHDLGIVHRDLKPENIHVRADDTGRDRIKVVDFGLAKVIGATRLTRAGVVFGTPHYMSPEQAAGDATDHRADIYALGIVTYEMLVGRVPFEADSYMGVLTKHMYMIPTPPSQLPGMQDLGAFEDLLMRCLQKKPEQRYSSMRDLLADLERLPAAGALPPSSLRAAPAPAALLGGSEPPAERPSRASVFALRAELPVRPLWPLFGVALAFVLGVGLVLARRHLLRTTSAVSAPAARPLGASNPARVGPRVSPVVAAALAASASAPPPEPTPAPAASLSGSALPPVVAAPPRESAALTPAAPAPATTAPLQATAESQVAAPAAAASAAERAGLAPRPRHLPPPKPARPGMGEIIDPWAH